MSKRDTFGFVTTDLARRYVARFEQRAAEFSLTLGDCKVLAHLDRSEGINQIELCKLTAIHPMMMVRILDRMEASRLIERQKDPQDRRAKRLFLTKKAQPLLAQIAKLSEQVRAEVFAGVDPADAEVFMRTLLKLYRNLLAFEDEQTAAASSASQPARAEGRVQRTSR
ncbi:MarR family winged helix-turn-helix transcriptional regulator [Peristeroidobacter soli]|uniref:MarR family winged helix-turn-helix transcriptional regulator n=1 Tax=Peristeroidobacter soli TaxID=2497877 RepID=UPI00101D3999|nr:MarR family transcriptional regulator [Peristeroidobacter soli]